MELRHLRYFLTVAEESSLTGAAKRLLVAQPSLSRQIRDLERAVGEALFHRVHSGVELTDAGRRLLPLARDAVAAFDRVVPRPAAEPRSVPPARRSPFTIGLHFCRMAALGLTRPIVNGFRRQHPELDVRTVDLDAGDPIRALRAGAVDVALLRGPAADDIAVAPLFSEPQGIAVTAADPLADAAVLDPDDVADRLFLPRGPLSVSLWRDVSLGAWDTSGLRFDDTVTRHGLDAIAAARRGVAFLVPMSAHTYFPQAADLRTVAVRRAPRLVCSVARRADDHSTPVRAFTSFATDLADRCVPAMGGITPA